jgi:AAA+ ATPase superfamily predicted ATPase
MKIVGRYEEQESLQQYVDSEKPEFVAVYGRRRVGKTFLIKEFFRYWKIAIDKRSIVECYMILGGIPFYLDMMEKGLSLTQNIDNLCFSGKGTLWDEFTSLYAS